MLRKLPEIPEMTPTMSWTRRVRLWEVMGDETRNPEMLQALWHLNNLVRCDEVLEWLIREKKTGPRFIQFLKEQGSSVLWVASEILKRLEHEKVRRPIIAGRDYLE